MPAKKTQTRISEPSEPKFTARELEVIALCCKGLSCSDIAQAMGISLRTVDTHKTHIFKKAGIKNSTGLMHYALTHKLSKL